MTADSFTTLLLVPRSRVGVRDGVRRTCALLATVAFLLGASLSTKAQQGDRTVRLAQVTELPASAKRFAIVIGVDAYEDQQITGLVGAGNDASALASVLIECGGFPKDQVFLMTSKSGERPTRPNILRRLANLKGVVPKDGLLLVAFSGHGIDRGGRGFLLPADAQSLSNVALLEETAVSVDRVREFILDTGVGQVLFVIDACRNDPTAGRGDSDNSMSAAFERGFSFDVANREVQAFATLYATEIGHRAFENRARGRGYFSEALVEGLAGKAANERGEVTLGALVAYLETTVPRRIALDYGTGSKQRPSARVELYRASELIVSKVAASAAAAPVTPASAPVVVDPKAVEVELWSAIKESRDAADFEDYLKRYPAGTYEGVARAKIKQLRPVAMSEPSTPLASGKPGIQPSIVPDRRQSIGYRFADKVTTIVQLRGTTDPRMVNGSARIKRQRGLTDVELELDNMVAAYRLGADFTTYVCWAAAPSGECQNVGELILTGGRCKLRATTRFDTFAIIITAEPHYAVSKPSSRVVAELTRSERSGADNVAEVQYTGDPGRYVSNDQLTEAMAVEWDRQPLPLLGARRAVQIAKLSGAEIHAAAELDSAIASLRRAESLVNVDQEAASGESRQAIRQAQRARELAEERGGLRQ